jgi:hypothetical protein
MLIYANSLCEVFLHIMPPDADATCSTVSQSSWLASKLTPLDAFFFGATMWAIS